MSQFELAQEVRVRPETLAKVIDRLERGALIVRSGRGVDGRNVRVVITAEGREVLERAFTLEEEHERTLGSDEQLRTELIARIQALGINTGAERARPALRLVQTDDQREDDDTSNSSAAG